jgi:hypothetical protein
MTEPVVIVRGALYDDALLRRALGLTEGTLAAARRSGALRHTRRGTRTLYKGEWVLEWLESDPTTIPVTGRGAPDEQH